MFIISEATIRDVPTIVDIAEKTWWPTYGDILPAKQLRYMLDTIYAPETLRLQIENGIQTYLILRDEGASQAFASYGQRPDQPESYKLHKLYVLPGNHHKGYGRVLIKEIKDRLIKQNIHALELNVNRHNSARTFYERCGFEIVREEDVPIGPYWMNDYVMRSEF